MIIYKDKYEIPCVSAGDMEIDVLKDSQIRINQLSVDDSTACLVPINSGRQGVIISGNCKTYIANCSE